MWLQQTRRGVQSRFHHLCGGGQGRGAEDRPPPDGDAEGGPDSRHTEQQRPQGQRNSIWGKNWEKFALDKMEQVPRRKNIKHIYILNTLLSCYINFWFPVIHPVHQLL